MTKHIAGMICMAAPPARPRNKRYLTKAQVRKVAYLAMWEGQRGSDMGLAVERLVREFPALRHRDQQLRVMASMERPLVLREIGKMALQVAPLQQ